MWYVERNGERVGPVSYETVANWAAQGMTTGLVKHVDWEHFVQINQTDFARYFPRATPSGGSGCSTIAIICVALAALFGGCAFIVTEPVVALAIFFVGIPFVVLVLWLTGALLSRK